MTPSVSYTATPTHSHLISIVRVENRVRGLLSATLTVDIRTSRIIQAVIVSKVDVTIGAGPGSFQLAARSNFVVGLVVSIELRVDGRGNVASTLVCNVCFYGKIPIHTEGDIENHGNILVYLV